MVDTIKFSQFVNAGDLANGETTVGLASGTNAYFNNPWTFLASGTTGDRPVPSAAIYYRLRFNTSLQEYEYYDPISSMWTEFGSGSGNINPGVTNDLAFYAANGTDISPISAAANSVLVTNGSDVPSLSTTLPSGLTIPGATITGSTAALTSGSVAAAPVSGTDITNKTYVDGLFASGVESITGTTNQVIASSPTGNVTLSLPQDIATGSTPTFGGMTLTSIPLSLNSGGTDNQLTASLGGIVYSDATKLQILAGTATAKLPLLSGSSAAPTWGAYALNLGGALTTAGALTTSGAYGVTFTFTGTTGVTFPTSGTLATTSQIPSGAALTETNDTNVTLTLGGSPSTALVNAASITAGWTGQLSLARGGSNASLTASNGGIVYSTASAMAILAGTATAGQLLTSGASTTPAWTTTTYPATNAVNTLLYASSANVMAALATANNGVLITSNSGVPSWLANSGTPGYVLTANSGAPPSWQNISADGAVSAVDTDSGNITPSAGVITITGSSTGLTTTGSGSTVGLTGNLALSHGGLNANLTASNGGIFYSTASAGAILAGTATAGQLLTSGASTTPAWTTSTYPATNAANTLLYASSANTMAALATANSSVLVTSSGGVPSWSTTLPSFTTGTIAFNPTTGGLIGTTAADNASSGKVGEVISSSIPVGTPVSLTTGQAANVTSISLTAGDWDVWGNVVFGPGNTTTTTGIIGWISTTSASLPDPSLRSQQYYAGVLGSSTGDLGMAVPYVRVNVSSTTSVYLSVEAIFATSTMVAAGVISARRAR